MKYGTYVCNCGEEATFQDSNWEEVRSFGWRAFKEEGEWQHSCPDCVKEWASKQTNGVKKASRPAIKAYEVVMEALTGRGFSDAEANMLIVSAKRR